nr:zinc ribbon domain-containing protein [uncultured Blautia sp.]
MGNDFFSGIGAIIAKTARNISQKAEDLYEVQKIRNQLSGEEQLAEKAMMDIGRVIYARYEQGEGVDGELGILCQEISQHMQVADHYRDVIAAHNGEKYCPACHKAVMREANFCPYCGAACPTPELEEQARDVIEQIDDDVKDAQVVGETEETTETEGTEDKTDTTAEASAETEAAGDPEADISEEAQAGTEAAEHTGVNLEKSGDNK